MDELKDRLKSLEQNQRDDRETRESNSKILTRIFEILAGDGLDEDSEGMVKRVKRHDGEIKTLQADMELVKSIPHSQREETSKQIKTAAWAVGTVSVVELGKAIFGYLMAGKH